MSSLFRFSTLALVAAATLFALPQQAHAQLVVGGTTGSEGDAFEFRVLSSGNAVIQTIYDASAISSLSIGQTITGIAFRLDGAAVAASPALTFADYDIFLGGASAARNGNDFSGNYNAAQPRTQVRSGLLSFASGSFLAEGTSAPAPFGPTITFDSPYAYTGGDLIIEIRHSGNGGPNFNVDGTAFGTFGSTWNNIPSTGNGGAASSTPVTRLSVGPAVVPESGTGAMIAFAVLPVLGAVVARRKGAK